MRFTISANGKPSDVRQQVQKQIEGVRRDDADAGLLTAAISDALGRKLHGLSADADVSINATVDCTITTSVNEAIEQHVTATAQPANQPATPQIAPQAAEGARPVPVPGAPRPDVAQAAALVGATNQGSVANVGNVGSSVDQPK